MKRSPSTIFIGNVDFDVPESQIVNALSTVGKVVSFKLIYDKTTGKSKGYGFAEYESPLIAQAAINTLNLSFNGRKAKINPTEVLSTPQADEALTTINKKDLDTKLSNDIKKMFEVLKIFVEFHKNDGVNKKTDAYKKNLMENVTKVILFLKKKSLVANNVFKKMLNDEENVFLLFECLKILKIIDVDDVNE